MSTRIGHRIETLEQKLGGTHERKIHVVDVTDGGDPEERMREQGIQPGPHDIIVYVVE